MGYKKFRQIVIEISSICNATCKYCTTGILNRRDGVQKGKFMTPLEMEKAIRYLMDKKIVENGAEIVLYNWGEPFLNPHLNEICYIISKYGFKYNLSTNASRYIELDLKNLENLTNLWISVSSFNQIYQKKIHGFNVDTIRNNIIQFAEHFGKANLKRKIVLTFHVYQFNTKEYSMIKDFCNMLGIIFSPNFAYFADYDDMNQMLGQELGNKNVGEGMSDLFTFYYEEVIQNRPINYKCPQKEVLVLDSELNMLPCCRLTSKNVLGNLYKLDIDEIFRLKNSTKCCAKCMERGQDYLVHNIPSAFDYFEDGTQLEYCTVYFDRGNGYNEEDSVKYPFCMDRYTEIKINIPDNALKLRFDPIEGKNVVISCFKTEIRGGGGYRVHMG